MPDDTKTIGQYDEDYYVWALTQAHALRSAGAALADARANAWPSTLSGLDWENLAEEIESLGRRDRRELGSRIETIIEHLAKLESSPPPEPRLGWQETIDRSRDAIETILRDSPSLRGMVPSLIAEVSDRGVRLEARSLKRHGEELVAVHLHSRYTPDQILTDWWPDNPAIDDRPDNTKQTEANS